MVGVPAFDKCCRGPSSLMFCPTFSLRKYGIITGPKTRDVKTAIPAASNVPITTLFNF
jgi:hypothetical protein